MGKRTEPDVEILDDPPKNARRLFDPFTGKWVAVSRPKRSPSRSKKKRSLTRGADPIGTGGGDASTDCEAFSAGFGFAAMHPETAPEPAQ